MTKIASVPFVARAALALAFTLMFIGESSAQQPVITMYVDVGEPGSTVDIYVEQADQTDMSSWPGAYHTDYNSSASVSGGSGSDGTSGGGLGPYWLSVPWEEDDEIDVYGGVSFWCSIGGPLGGSPPPETVSTFTYRYNYVWNRTVLDGDTWWHVYEAAGAMPRACKFPEVWWVGLAQDGRMRTEGVGQGVVGTDRVGCLHVCYAGHTTATDKAGTGTAAIGCS